MINFKDIQLDQLIEFTTAQLINEMLSDGFKELPLITSKQLE